MPSLLLFFVFEKTFAEIPIILHALVLLGLFLLPAAIMNVAVGKDLTLLRTDYLIKQVARDFIPYVVIFILLAAAIFMQMFAKQYNPKEPSETWIYFLFNFAAQMVFIYAMRAIGLFYRHYSCHTPW